MTTMVITTISSTKVNPRALLTRRRGDAEENAEKTFGRLLRVFLCASAPPRRSSLPVSIRTPIGRFLIGLGVDVEHILAAPAHRGGVILVAPQAPVFSVSEGIARDAP